MTARPPKADATTWVSKDKDGVLTPVKVVDMDDGHLFRWVRYFRKKFREKLPPTMPDELVDARIKVEIVTAPAIYAEAIKRGVLVAPLPAPDRPKAEEPAPGKRRITLEDD